eukprot:48465-Prymnesium_polylepis.1
MRIRARAVAAGTVANWAADYAVVSTFLGLTDAMGDRGAFLLCASAATRPAPLWLRAPLAAPRRFMARAADLSGVLRAPCRWQTPRSTWAPSASSTRWCPRPRASRSSRFRRVRPHSRPPDGAGTTGTASGVGCGWCNSAARAR